LRVGIINRIIINIIFTLLIFSCGGISKINKKSKINVQTQYWNTTEDSLNFYVHISIPLNHFVFRKQMDHFSSEIIYTLVISDDEGKTQLYRESWREKISEPYYENTRDLDNLVKTEKNIGLIPGEYKLFLNVQDEDSRKSWKITKTIKYIGSEPKKESKVVLQNTTYRHKPVAYTVNTFIKRFKSGTYILLVKGHALVVKNGVMIDNPNYQFNGYRRVVESAFQVKNGKKS
jgi:hypothetical protein